MSLSEKPTFLVCYDQHELTHLLPYLRVVSEVPIENARSPLYRGTLDGNEVALLRLPFGDKPQVLQQCLAEGIQRLRPRLLLSLGTAMACRPALTIGTLLVTQQAFHQGKIARFSHNLCQEALTVGRHTQTIVLGSSFTSSTFIKDSGDVSQILAQFPSADMVEMEDYHLATLAESNGISCLSVRAVTDYGSFDDHIKALPAVVPELLFFVRRFLRFQRGQEHLTSIPNTSCTDISFFLFIVSELSSLPIPDAVSIARHVSRALALSRILEPGARVNIRVCANPLLKELQAPQKLGHIFSLGSECRLCVTPDRRFADIVLSKGFLEDPELTAWNCLMEFEKAPLLPVSELDVEQQVPAVPFPGRIHIQGLNSISAEAEEGLLAATTIEEFQEHGLPIVDSSEADIWVYRTAHASNDSYFEPDYQTPMRKAPQAAHRLFRIATGLGPLIEPEARGGREADLLMLGDEQGGRLIQYLDDLGSASFGPSTVFRYPGVAQQLTRTSVALSRLDCRQTLTEQGLNRFSFSPEALRSVYSSEYDEFLRTYFSPRRRPTPPVTSYLFLTSRGCGNECSICCSGGFQPYSSLEPETIIRFLKQLKDRHSLQANEYIEIYLLDSNFNKFPQRVIRFSHLLESEKLRPFFEFYVRHNGLEGFLLSSPQHAQPRVFHHELIKAYQRLGIDEIVIGIDSYTETSVRMLKTSMTRLRREGASAEPSYTFAEIELVLMAIEKQGLKSRCFLLMNNPFTGDTDRVETFYNLLRLALNVPNFVIDYESSTQVNDLKPFPGAPITRIAQQLPGLISGKRFTFSGSHGEIEAFLRFDLFKERRKDPARLSSFLASIQQTRYGLGDFFFSRASQLPPRPHASRNALVCAALKFLDEEQRIQPLIATFIRDVPYFQELETQIGHLSQKLHRELAARDLDQCPIAPDQLIHFYQLLEPLS